MVGYGIVRQTIKKCVVLALVGWVLLYVMSGHKKPNATHYRYKQKVLQQQGYDIVARYSDSRKSITEHVVFQVQKDAQSSDHLVRNGILVRRPQAKATVLMCHGLGATKQDIGFLRILFPEYNIMTFDFRAHGEQSAGQYCTLGKDEAYDVVGAARFLKSYERTKGLPLFLYGFSMGAVAAIEAQACEPSLFKAMILDCPFDSVQSLIRRGLERLKFMVFGYEFSLPGRTWLEKGAFNPYTQPLVKLLLKIFAGFDTRNTQVVAYPVQTEHSIKKITIPCFFIHCKNDEKVPVEAIKLVFNNAAAEHKQLWITGGRRHFDSLFHEPDRYVRKVQKFFRRVLVSAYDEIRSGKIIDDSDHVRASLF
jgi:alpha-beta hydrolase superfamily lysophospholipase